VRLGPPAATITPESLKLVYGVDIAVVEIAADGGRRRVCVPALDAMRRSTPPAPSR
jgi:iron complex transport system ATP-binding protein